MLFLEKIIYLIYTKNKDDLQKLLYIYVYIESYYDYIITYWLYNYLLYYNYQLHILWLKYQYLFYIYSMSMIDVGCYLFSDCVPKFTASIENLST